MRAPAIAQILLIASLAACVGGCAVTRDDSATASSDVTRGRIDTGDPAVVALYFDGGDLHCTGTLVAPRVVMTAAHCAPSLDEGSRPMHAGIERLGPDGRVIQELVRVSRVAVNARYDGANIERGYDIAFAELARAVTTVAPLPIRRTPMSAADLGAEVRFVGYGLDENGALGTKRQAWNRVASVTGNMFTGGRGADTCNGDSGGPALMRVDGVEVVAGVTSFGDPSCTGGGSYSRVDVFASDVDRAVASAGGPGDPRGEAEGPPQLCESRATCLPESGCTCTTGDVGAVCCTDVTCAAGAADPANCSPRCRTCR